MNLIVKAYKILSILYLIICILGHISLERRILYEISKYQLLDFPMPNCFSILSMYANWDNPINFLDLSL